MRLLQTQESVNPYVGVKSFSNDVEFEFPTRAIWVITAISSSSTALTFADGTILTMTDIPVGIYKIAVKKISANTTKIKLLY
jgi:hypothetical protein